MAGTTRLELATSAVTGSVVRFYKNLEDRGDCQSTRKSSKTSHFVDWVVGWKLARSSEEFASAYATRAEHFLDGLWLDSADLHSCPMGRGVGIGPVVVQAFPDAVRIFSDVGLGGAKDMHLQVLVGTIAKELRAARPEIG